MRTQIIRMSSLILAALIYAVLPELVASGKEPPPQLAIESAEAHYDTNRLVIKGANFGDVPPVVMLGDEWLVVWSATSNEVVASLPPVWERGT